MSFVTDIKTFAALGSGVIGSGWVARALANGLDVVAWDPAPGAEAALRARIAKCWGALEANGLASKHCVYKSKSSLISSQMFGLQLQHCKWVKYSTPLTVTSRKSYLPNTFTL